MHKIKNNPSENDDAVNKEYVDSKEKTISWNDYQALSEEEKNNGTTYFIPDMPSTDNVGDVKFYTSLSQLGLTDGCSIGDVFNSLPDNSYFEYCIISTGGVPNISDVPSDTIDSLLTIKKFATKSSNTKIKRFNIEIKKCAIDSIATNTMYIGQLKGSDGKGIVWNKVLTNGDFTDTIDDTSTDENIAGALSIYKAILKSKYAKRMDESINPENYEVGAWFAEGHDSVSLNTNNGHPCSEWHIGYVVTGYKASNTEGYKIILAIAMSGNCYVKVQQWNNWTKWIKLGTTSVNDISKTNITISYPSAVKNNTSDISYSVTNGICTVTYDLSFSTTSGVNWTVIATGLPKPKDGDIKRSTPAHNGKDSPLILNVNAGCCLVMYMIATTTNNPHYIDSFSYAIAES